MHYYSLLIAIRELVPLNSGDIEKAGVIAESGVKCANCPARFAGPNAQRLLARHINTKVCSKDSSRIKCGECEKT